MSTRKPEDDRAGLLRFYRLTPAGRKQLTSEKRQWERLAAAVGRVLSAETPAG